MTAVLQLNNLKDSLQFVLKWEVGNTPNGGYTNDPTDLGGETKYGISKRAHPNEDIKNLTPERAAEIYAAEYWLPAGCDSMPYPFCCVVFDTAVLHGVGKAVYWLRQSDNIRQYLNLRRMYYYELVRLKPAQNRFLDGWLRRVNDLGKLVDIAQENPGQDQMAPKWGSLG